MGFSPGGFHMGPTADPAVYGSSAAFTGREFAATEIGYMMFAVDGISAGSVTIEVKFHENSGWQDLDSTNLVFTAPGVVFTRVGGCLIRAVGAALTDGLNNPGGVFIFGPYVFVA